MSKKDVKEIAIMTKKQNLHFLLALGNTKMVVLKKEDRLQVYTSDTKKQTVDSSRVAEALTTR